MSDAIELEDYRTLYERKKNSGGLSGWLPNPDDEEQKAFLRGLDVALRPALDSAHAVLEAALLADSWGFTTERLAVNESARLQFLNRFVGRGGRILKRHGGRREPRIVVRPDLGTVTFSPTPNGNGVPDGWFAKEQRHHVPSYVAPPNRTVLVHRTTAATTTRWLAVRPIRRTSSDERWTSMSVIRRALPVTPSGRDLNLNWKPFR